MTHLMQFALPLLVPCLVDDPSIFQGKWAATAMEVNGRNMPQDEVNGLVMIVRGEKFAQFRGAATVDAGTYRLFPDRSPKQAEFTITEGPARGKVQLAIYEIDVNLVRFCLSAPGEKTRPPDFDAPTGSNRVLMVMKRLD